MKRREGRARSIVKALSWRFMASIITFLLVYFLSGGKAILALNISLLEVITKLVAYYVHERVWDKIPWLVSNK